MSVDILTNLNEFSLKNSLEFIMYAKYICQKFVGRNIEVALFLHTFIVKISSDKFESNELKEIDKKL